ncbi:MAG: MucBP domain-containing protein [Clostridia bacterium]|nr:MucBP domain-containing protein [Clostridia bacterium]
MKKRRGDMKKRREAYAKKRRILFLMVLGIFGTIFLKSNVVRTSNTNASYFADDEQELATNVTVDVVNNPKIDIMVTQKDSELDMTNFDSDIIARLQDYGLDTSNVQIQTVKRDIISTNATDASVIFDNWGRIGQTGQWSITTVNGKNTIQNAENTACLTGFYDPNGFNTTNMTFSFNARSTDSDNDVLGCMFRFNITSEGTSNTTKKCTAYVFIQDGGEGYPTGLYKLTNYYFDAGGHPGTKSPVTGVDITSAHKFDSHFVKLASSTQTWTRNTWSSYRIICKNNNIKIYQNDKLLIDYTDTADDAIPSGSYGFFSWSQPYVQFNDVSVETTDAKAFKDVLLEPTWREDAKHIVVNVDDTIDESLTGTDTIGEILSRTLNDDIHFIQWGTDTNKVAIEDFIAKNDNKGVFTANNDYETAVDTTVEYIKKLIENESSSQYVIVGEDSSILVTPESLKNNAISVDFPNGRWMIHHNYTYYDNNLGQSTSTEVYTPDLLCTFDKPGEYNIFFDDELVKTVYAHRRPVADFSININNGAISLSSNSFDLDLNKDIGYGNGISSENWYYKKANDVDWTPGKLTTFDKGEIYVIKLEVTDFQGVTSYTTKYVGIGSPVASFNYSANTITKYQDLVINDTSYDPSGYEITDWTWTLKKGSVIVGTYTGKTPSVINFNTDDLGTGTYSYSLVVTNSQGIKSEVFTKSFTVIDDTDAPAVIIDPTHCEWKKMQEVSLLFSDADSGFSKWRYAIDSEQETSENTVWSEYITDTSYLLNIDVEGLDYLHIQAYDNAGNLLERTVGIYKIDRTQPNGNGEITQPTIDERSAIINFTATDDASGVEKIILPDGREVTGDNAIYSVTSPGEYTFKVVDVAGNEKEVVVPVAISSDGVEIKYIDQVTGDEIISSNKITGDVGTEYSTLAEIIPGYELVKTPENASGIFTMDKIIVTYEYRKTSTVTVKYIDMNTDTSIVNDIVTEYKEGDPYQTEQKTFNEYTLISNTENTSGTVGRENIEVVYRYRKISSGVDIVYIDQVTKSEIVTRDHQDGMEGTDYTTLPKKIEGYELVLTPENAIGKMTVEKITVTYEYRKISTVTVKYIDKNTGTSIIDNIVTEYKEGDPYKTEEKNFNGYKLISNTENTDGTVGRENIEVIYEYRKISSGVDTVYIDQVTKEEIDTGEHEDGLEGTEYTTIPKKIDGYELVLTPENATGKMTVGKITVTYEYRKLSKVIIKHIDANTGNAIANQTEKEYKEGVTYTTKSEDIGGYVVTKVPENSTGTMGRENIEVVYEYKKVSEGLIVKYVDKITGEVLDEKQYTGNENNVITLEEKKIDGYELVQSPENKEIILTVALQEVKFYYQKISKVQILGIDQISGEELYLEEKEGLEGENYQTEGKVVDGYQLVESTENENGVYTREGIVVKYWYKKISGGVVIRYIDQDTQEILKEKRIDGLEGEEYRTEKENFEKYNYLGSTENIVGNLKEEVIEVEYYYEKKIGKVEIIYEDEEGNELLKEIIEGKVDEEYKVEEKEIRNYRVKEKPQNTEGVFELDTITVKYIMEKIPGKVIINLVDEDGNVLDRIEKDGYVGEICEIVLPEKEGYYVEDKIVRIDYQEDPNEINIIYKKTLLPNTSDINIWKYVILFLVMMIGAVGGIVFISNNKKPRKMSKKKR